MKKRFIAVFMLVIVAVVFVAAFTACDNDALLDSTWEMAVALNEHGEVIACGEDYTY